LIFTLSIPRFPVNPPYVYGPFSPGFQHVVGKEWKHQFATGNRPLSTAGNIYSLLDGEKANNFLAVQPAPYVDIRDVAKVHIDALQLDRPIPEPLHAPRLLVVSPHLPKFGEAIEVIRKERPNLEDRLARLTDVQEGAHSAEEGSKNAIRTGLKRVEEVLGIKEDEYKTFTETIIDTVDSLIALEEFVWEG
jgi:nucleoside-diphosphate-sugar epimerase